MMKPQKPVLLKKETKKGAHYIRRDVIEATPIITEVKDYINLISFTPTKVLFNLSSD